MWYYMWTTALFTFTACTLYKHWFGICFLSFVFIFGNCPFVLHYDSKAEVRLLRSPDVLMSSIMMAPLCQRGWVTRVLMYSMSGLTGILRFILSNTQSRTEILQTNLRGRDTLTPSHPPTHHSPPSCNQHLHNCPDFHLLSLSRLNIRFVFWWWTCIDINHRDDGKICKFDSVLWNLSWAVHEKTPPPHSVSPCCQQRVAIKYNSTFKKPWW